MFAEGAKTLRTLISLPSVADQRRFVVRIEELAAHINEARNLREQAIEEVELLFRSIILPRRTGKANTDARTREACVL